MSNAKRKDQPSSTKDKDVFRRIKKNYLDLNQTMVNEIELASVHDVITGSYREEMWMKFFRSIIPLKYSLAQSVLIIDSKKRVSKEVDIAVYDEQYTPYVFQYNTLKFIPIEAVAVAIECKSSDWTDSALKGWAESIRTLEPCGSGIARMTPGYSIGITNQTQKRTRPIFILASNLSRERETAIENNIAPIKDFFDFILLKQSEKGSKGQQQQFRLEVKNEDKRLGWWGKELNGTGTNEEPDCGLEILRLSEAKGIEHIKSKYPEITISENHTHLENTLENLRIPGNTLLTLNFQLNQLLMLLNNPMLFPHLAYAKAFKEIEESKENPSS